MAAQPEDVISPHEAELEMQGLADYLEKQEVERTHRLTVSRGDLDRELGEQSRKLFTAEAMVASVAEALQVRFGHDWPGDVPDYRRVLHEAAQHIRGAYENLEVLALEHNAEMRAQGGAS